MYKNKGFTLIELAIVMVIMGLLISGILAGVSLISSAKSLTVIADSEKYNNAFNAFNNKYRALPGDMFNAHYNPSTSPNGLWEEAYANGNGNHSISSDELNDTTEELLVWNHLVAAELIDGGYDGVLSVGDYEIQTNIPKSKFEGGGYVVTTQNRKHYLRVGGEELADEIRYNYPIFTALDASAIDEKFDDGIATRGKFIASGEDCIADDEEADITKYNYDEELRDEVICVGLFKIK